MTILLHTADWHLGKSFYRFAGEPDVQVQLRQKRLDAIDRLGAAAREVGAAAILVAGDVFHTSEVADKVVVAALERIGALDVPVIAIPGNHDHAGPSTVWRRESLVRHRERLAPNLRIVLDGPECIPVADVDVIAAPVSQRMHGQSIAALGAVASRPGCARVGLVHGAKDEFREDEESRALDLARDAEAKLAYLALGDYHRLQRVEGLHCETWYSGTHEPDGFPSHHQEGERVGGCMIVELAGGALVRATPRTLPDGMRWSRLVRAVQDDAALQVLAEELRALAKGRVQTTLVSLDVAGSRLGFAAAQALDALC
ncbi:MAG: repair exonuclease, partial [Planctomycetota bacterium]